MDQQTTFRIVPPRPSSYKPLRGETRYEERQKTWPERRDRWIEYYERGDGYREAVSEARSIVARHNYTRNSFVYAAQWVGWSVRRLVYALVTDGIEVPERLRLWAQRHVQRYRQERKS